MTVPHSPLREEIWVDAGLADGDEVPVELGDLVLGIRGGRPLVRIARVSTERSVTCLLDAQGRRLAEIDDDTVRASSSGVAAIATAWREVDVALGAQFGEDEVELLDAVGKRLRRVGAARSGSNCELARALALPAAPARRRGGKNFPKSHRHAGDVLYPYLLEQHRVIVSGDLALRRGEDTVIHPTRVATRRLRSTVRVFHPLIDDKRGSSIDAELRWYAALLGEVRDRQVLRKRLDAMLGGLDETLTLGPVRARIDQQLREEQGEHWQRLQDELTGPRYLALLDDLNDWMARPPWTRLASKPAKTVAPFVRHAERTVARRLRRANASGDIHQLHATRKAAKRARYAAEAAEPVIGTKASAAHATRYETLQDLLGEHQDSILSADLLRRLGAKAATMPGENGFAFGILHEREQQRARDARDKAHRTARKYQ